MLASKAQANVLRRIDGDLAIADVGRACGYLDAASFSRAFRRWEGVSASDFRLGRRDL